MTQMLRVTCLALLCAASSGCENDSVPGPKKHDNFGLDGGSGLLPPWLDAATIDASPGPDAPLADVLAVLDESIDAAIDAATGYANPVANVDAAVPGCADGHAAGNCR